MINTVLAILIISFFIVMAGLFAGSETGIYQLSRLRLRIGVERKKISFIILAKTLRDSPGLLISTLLGANLFYYLTTSTITYILLKSLESESPIELLTTLIATPVLFIFADVIPKNIFFCRADVLMPSVAPFLFASQKICTWCGAVSLLKSISGIFAKITGVKMPSKAAVTSVQKHHIAAILEDTHQEALLSSVQTDIINQLVIISTMPVTSVMISIGKVQLVDRNFDNTNLLNILKTHTFTRLPVYDTLPANITGFINIYETLCSTKQFSDLDDFTKPIRKISSHTTVTDAINIMQSENHKIALVVKTGRAEREKPVGIITMKDLVEELVGELPEW